MKVRSDTDIDWTALKSGAPYNATHGAFIADLALLQLPSQGNAGLTSVVICGLMTCGGETVESARNSAAKQAERYRGWKREPGWRRDIDHPINRKDFCALLRQD